jgi:DNA-binding XRE family transcriptional regulator
MMNTVSLQNAFVMTMTVSASLAGPSSDPQASAVTPGFAVAAATKSIYLPAVGVSPQQADVLSTQRPLSKRRQALLQTAQGQAMQVQALKDLGGALHSHGVAPLVALRMRCGLTQKALCEASGLPQPHISRLENGKVPNPDGATLQKLAAAMGMSMDDVMAAIEQGVSA